MRTKMRTNLGGQNKNKLRHLFLIPELLDKVTTISCAESSTNWW
jgi:hypothetical protein